MELDLDRSRRTFLKEFVGAGLSATLLSTLGCATNDGKAVAVAPQGQSGAQDQPSKAEPAAPPKFPNLRVAFIGVGGIGVSHLEGVSAFGVQCPCFCDVDTEQYKHGAKFWPNAKPYQDYREMIEKEAGNFDAVMIGTPDHHHYPATILAMMAGKHVYTQKPLTHTVWEARQLAQAAKKYKVATQMGNQWHAGEGWRRVYEFVNGGAIGDIREVHTWTDRPVWPQGIERPKEEDAVPASLNWDKWVGPAPMRPYKKGAYHQFAWRGWWDFGTGAMGDMACHTMDGVFWALNPGSPSSVEVIAAGPFNGESFQKASVLKWTFPRRGLRPGFASYWYDGGLLPQVPAALEFERRLPPTGNLFVGSKGTLMVSGDYGESSRLIPEARQKEFGKPKQLLERSPGHMLEWIMACAGEKPIDFPKSNFSYAGPMTEVLLLGNIALRFGRKLDWDSANMKFTNVPEATAFVSKEYRAGWDFKA